MSRHVISALSLILTAFALSSCANVTAKCGSKKPVVSESAIQDVSAASSEASQASGTQKALLQNKAHNVFTGTLNNKTVIIDIYANGSALSAAYITDSSKDNSDEITLSGKLSGTGAVTLSSTDQNFSLSGQTTADDTITGTYTENEKSSSFTLKLHNSFMSNSLQERYRGYDTKKVEDFVSLIKAYVIADDKINLSKLITYPVKVTLNGQSVTLQNAEDFTNNYDAIVNNGLKAAISSAYTKFMFNNYQGIMFGSGLKNVWISSTSTASDLKIKAINN